jgi:hypothetical protein
LIFLGFIFAKVYRRLLSIKFLAVIGLAGREENDNANQPKHQKESVFVEDTEAHRHISSREAEGAVEGGA